MVFRVFVLSCVCASVVAMPTVYNNSVETIDNEVHSYNFPFVTRDQWHARTPRKTTPLSTPVPYVVIHHSYIPAACYDREKCSAAMRHMQDYHMDGHDWWDIGYNFAVGSDGAAYEGRGWDILGAHALYFNTVSIGICLIGDWSFETPPAQQIKTAMSVIQAGVELGYIKPVYKLIGHRQVRDTECPGDALFNEIKTWEHFTPFPSSSKDLLNVEEIPECVKDIIRGYSFPFVSRKEWHARSPEEVTPLKIPVPSVVIHHTSTVPRCYDREACCEAMRKIQDYHMDDKGWWDIGYNFGVGSDGAVYEGRGWNITGAQALHFNAVSIGITFIGNWTYEVPPEQQINAVKALMKAGVELGYVIDDYTLFGHRDLRDTQCPGDALYGQIKTWPHFLPKIFALGPLPRYEQLLGET